MRVQQGGSRQPCVEVRQQVVCKCVFIVNISGKITTIGYYNFPITDFVKPKPITQSTCNSCKLDMSVPICRTKLFQNSYTVSFGTIFHLVLVLPVQYQISSLHPV